MSREDRYRRAEGQLDLFNDPPQDKWAFRLAVVGIAVCVVGLFATVFY